MSFRSLNALATESVLNTGGDNVSYRPGGRTAEAFTVTAIIEGARDKRDGFDRMDIVSESLTALIAVDDFGEVIPREGDTILDGSRLLEVRGQSEAAVTKTACKTAYLLRLVVAHD